MPIALPLIDLGALTGVLLLIGTLSVIAYTFARLANVLNFSVFGVHPLHNVADAIHNTIVAGCNDGIKTLDKWAIYLFDGLKTVTMALVHGVEDLANGTNDALSYLVHTKVPALVDAAIHDVVKVANNALTRVDSLEKSVAKDVARLDNTIDAKAKAAVLAAGAATATAIKSVRNEIGSDVTTLRQEISAAAHGATATAESVASEALNRLQTAENAAIGALDKTVGATGEDLRNLINEIPFTDIAAVIAAVPVLTALVKTLEAETGLENESCRSKVKQICATDPSVWTQLLTDLAPLGLVFSLRELVEVARPIIADTKDAIEHMAA